MSIVLKDGTVLPDIPSEVLTEHPYVTIGKFNDVTFDESYNLVLIPIENTYILCAASEPFFCMAKETSPYGLSIVSSMADAVVSLTATGGGADWNVQTGSMVEGLIFGDDVLVWANHDVCYATVDENDGLVLGTEVYFPDSTAEPKPPLILPDGTELPPLPSRCFDGTPYGVVAAEVETALVATDKTMVCFPHDIKNDGTEFESISNQSGRLRVWVVTNDTWSLVVDEEVAQFNDGFGGYLEQIKWSNHDILYLAAYNEADGSYTIGSEIARKSDENYRVTGGYMTSIANEARRLGGKTGGMLPEVTEATLRGLQSYDIPSVEEYFATNSVKPTLTIYEDNGETWFRVPELVAQSTEVVFIPNLADFPKQWFQRSEVSGYCNLLIKEAYFLESTVVPYLNGQELLEKVFAPKATRFYGSVAGCNALTEIKRDWFPSLVQLEYTSITDCANLERADFLSLSKVTGGCIAYCPKFKYLVIRNTKNVCTGDWVFTNCFEDTPLAEGKGAFIVPAALKSGYDAQWDDLLETGSKILTIEDYSVDGTLDGDIDWDRVDAYMATL